MKDEFSRCHPGINFIFYLLVLGVTLFYIHPVLLVLSGVTAAAYLFRLRGGKGLPRLFLPRSGLRADLGLFLLRGGLRSRRGGARLFGFFHGHSLLFSRL